MTTVAVNVPDQHARDWVEAVADMEHVRDLEVSADVLEAGELSELTARYGLYICAVRDLLTPEVGRYFRDVPPTAQTQLVSVVAARVRAAGEAGARLLSVRLGLERINEADEEAEISSRVGFLRRLAASLDTQGATLCLPIRYPLAYPGSREWGLAINMLHDVVHPNFRMALDIFPAELASDFDPSELFRKIGFRLGGVRFVYEPGLGEEASMDFLRRWADGLRRHGFKGVMVFAPKVRDPDSIPETCRMIDEAVAVLEERTEVNP